MFESLLCVDSCVCRLCLEADGVMSGIFEDEADDGSQTLRDKILLLASVQISPEDGLPCLICHTCKNKIEQFVNFKEQIECSYQILCQCVESSKEDKPAVQDNGYTIQSNKNTRQQETNETVQATSSSVCSNYGKDTNDGADYNDSYIYEYLDEEYDTDMIYASQDDSTATLSKNISSNVEQLKKDFDNEVVKTSAGRNVAPKKTSMKIKQKNRLSYDNFIQGDLKNEEIDADDFVQDDANSVPDGGFANLSYVQKDEYIMDDCQEEIVPRVAPLMLGVDDSPSYLCHLCLTEFKDYTISELKEHSLSHFGSRNIEAVCQNQPTFTCEDCGDHFKKRYAFINHQRSKLDIKVFGCLICSRSFGCKGKLTNHLRRVHSTGKNSFSCIFCDETFDNFLRMSEHQRTHTTDKPLICHICNKECINVPSLKYHLKRHKLGKEFCCEICGKSFYTASELERHKPSHSGQRKFPCQICPKAFCSKPELRRHLRYHFKIKRFECPLCDKKYVEGAVLKSHMNVHNNVRPYACNLCPSAFHNKNRLRRHLTNLHKIIQTKANENESKPLTNLVEPKFTKLCKVVNDVEENPISGILSYLPKAVVDKSYITVQKDGNILKDVDGNILNMEEIQTYTGNDGRTFYIVNEEDNASQDS